MIRPELVARNVPMEAWPRRYPLWGQWRVRGTQGSSIEILLEVRVFAVIRPVPPWENGHSFQVAWDRYPDVPTAWEFAKQVAGWA